MSKNSFKIVKNLKIIKILKNQIFVFKMQENI